MNKKLEENFEICEGNFLDTQLAKKAKENLLDAELVNGLSSFFKVLGDNTRIRILSVLSKDEMCVCTLSEVLDMNVSAISHQLKNLRNAGLIKSRRQGKQIYYSLDDEHVETVFIQGLAHIKHKHD